jgi:hypothetical protein
VLVAKRSRAGRAGPVGSRLRMIISRGAGFAFGPGDVLPEQILDDQAEIVVDDGRVFPAVGFTVGPNNFAFHAGDAAAVLAALEKTSRLTLRSDGGAIAPNK